MAAHAGRRVAARAEYWPSFVDVLTNLLLVFIFLLSIFALMQFLLSREVSTKDEVMNRLNAQIAELTELLALERASTGEVSENLVTLEASLSAAEIRARPAARPARQPVGRGEFGRRPRRRSSPPSSRTRSQVSQRALAQVELLNQQISALRRQIAALEDALDASEDRDRESQTKIADLGRRLNVALAQRVQELSRYRSDFFGRLREILGDRPDIRIVGDRFVFQSEVFFETGSDEIGAEGLEELDKLAAAIVQLNAGNPGRHPLGAAHRRPHRQAADHQPRRPLPDQLGPLRRARHLGGPAPDRRRRPGRPARSRPASASSSRSRRARPRKPSARTAGSS